VGGFHCIALQYDHHEFPGVVPRTFIGAAVVAAVSKPLQYLVQDMLQLPKIAMLYVGSLVWRHRLLKKQEKKKAALSVPPHADLFALCL
jgi:alpha-1,6-mannosyltransferase